MSRARLEIAVAASITAVTVMAIVAAAMIASG
jgi:hypothetical protein